jgi:hypothetical protein
MTDSDRLRLYEKAFLIGLRDESGTFEIGSTVELAIAGAIVAQLEAMGRIAVAEDGKGVVSLLDDSAVGDAVVDDALDQVAAAARPRPLAKWIAKIGGHQKLRRRVAEQLRARGLLRAEKERVLLIFPRTVYRLPDSRPKRRVVDALRRAIFSDARDVESGLAVLVGVCDAAGTLACAFDRRDLRDRREQIERLTDGDAIARATAKAVKAARARAGAAAAAAGG